MKLVEIKEYQFDAKILSEVYTYPHKHLKGINVYDAVRNKVKESAQINLYEAPFTRPIVWSIRDILYPKPGTRFNQDFFKIDLARNLIDWIIKKRTYYYSILFFILCLGLCAAEAYYIGTVILTILFYGVSSILDILFFGPFLVRQELKLRRWILKKLE